jgi:hypothetical protein
MALPPETILNGIPRGPDSYRYGSFSFAHEEEDPYFVTHAKPEGLDIVKKRADDFIRIQRDKKRSVVLVTSGGSTVPLEVMLPTWRRMRLYRRIKRYGSLITSVREHGEHVLVPISQMTCGLIGS